MINSSRGLACGSTRDFQEGPSFSCPETAYSFPFSEILELGWSGVQKVWLDGNFLTGSIPEDIADKWPLLASLDLYSNSMVGTVPASLAKLPMVKLQLHENNFSGELPPALFGMLKTRKHLTLGVSGNPQLTGCYKSRGQHGIGGTQITACEDKQGGELDKHGGEL